MPLTKVQIGMTDAPTSGTAVTASGTSVDFNGIPSTAKRITVMFSGVSTNGSSQVQVQLGDSGGVETTGYLSSSSVLAVSSVASINSTSGFQLYFGGNDAAAAIRQGSIILTLLGSNIWAAQGVFALSNVANTNTSSGTKTLSDTLDRVRITTVNGTDTFDAGTINILYE